MKLEITATTRPDPLGRPGMIQVRLCAVACRDNGTPYTAPDGNEIIVEREAIRPASDDAVLAKSLAAEWEPKARAQLATALAVLGFEQAVSGTPKSFKVTL